MHKKRIREHAALAMAGLPPRVWKVDVNRRQARIGQQAAGEKGGIAVDDAGIGGMPGGEFAAAETGVATTDLDAEKIMIGPRRRGRAQKQSLAAAHLQFHRRTCREQGSWVERRRQGREFEKVPREIE